MAQTVWVQAVTPFKLMCFYTEVKDWKTLANKNMKCSSEVLVSLQMVWRNTSAELAEV